MKLCGRNELCFVEGKHWGHFSGVMCEHLGETNNNKSMCLLTKDVTKVYTNKREYDELTHKRGPHEGV